MYHAIHACLIGLVLAAGADSTSTQVNSLSGTWHGTSTCVDKVRFPACKDEEVIYEARRTHSAPDTVAVKADKIVKGERLFMGELFFTPQPDSTWLADVHTPRVHFRLSLRRAGDRLIGVMIDVPSARRIRDIALELVR